MSDIVLHNDGALINTMLGAGIPGRDKSLGYQSGTLTLIDQRLADLLHGESFECRSVIETIPEEMTREGWELTVDDAKPEIIEQITNYDRKLGLVGAFRDAQIKANMYGGAIAILLIDDGQPSDRPVDENRIKTIEAGTSAIDRWQVNAIGGTLENPEHYQIVNQFGLLNVGGNTLGSGLIHHSRVLRFDGDWAPQQIRLSNQGWGYSKLQRFLRPFQDYFAAYGSLGAMLADASIFTYKIKGLLEMIKQGKEGLLRARLQENWLATSTYGAMITDAELEDASFVDRNFGNLDQVCDRFERRLVAGSDGLPHSYVLGRSSGSGGLSGNGEDEEKYMAKLVKRRQEKCFRENLERSYNLIFAAKDSPVDKAKTKFTLNFRPLYLPTVQEIADLEVTVIQKDAAAISSGIYTADEAAESHYKSPNFNPAITIDWEKRESVKAEAATAETAAAEEELAALEAEAPVEEEPIEEEFTDEDAIAVEEEAPKVLFNGAQISSLVDVIKSVGVGEIPRDAAVQVIALSFGLTEEAADAIIGTAGSGFKPKVIDPGLAPIDSLQADSIETKFDKPCGKSHISDRKKCSKDKLSVLTKDLKAGDAGAKKRVAEGKKKAAAKQQLHREVERDRGKKATDEPESLEQLFIGADRIGKKYQSPEEIASFENQQAKINEGIGKAIDDWFPEDDNAPTPTRKQQPVKPIPAASSKLASRKLPSAIAGFLTPKSIKTKNADPSPTSQSDVKKAADIEKPAPDFESFKKAVRKPVSGEITDMQGKRLGGNYEYKGDINIRYAIEPTRTLTGSLSGFRVQTPQGYIRAELKTISQAHKEIHRISSAHPELLDPKRSKPIGSLTGSIATRGFLSATDAPAPTPQNDVKKAAIEIKSEDVKTAEQRAAYAEQEAKRQRSQGNDANATAWEKEASQARKTAIGRDVKKRSQSQTNLFGVTEHATDMPLFAQTPQKLTDINGKKATDKLTTPLTTPQSDVKKAAANGYKNVSVYKNQAGSFILPKDRIALNKNQREKLGQELLGAKVTQGTDDFEALFTTSKGRQATHFSKGISNYTVTAYVDGKVTNVQRIPVAEMDFLNRRELGLPDPKDSGLASKPPQKLTDINGKPIARSKFVSIDHADAIMPAPIAVQRSVKLALSAKPKLPFKAQGILSIARLIAVGQVPDVEQVKGAIATLSNPKTPMAIAQLLGGNASLKWLKAVQAMAIAQSSRGDSFAVQIDAKGMAIANQIRSKVYEI